MIARIVLRAVLLIAILSCGVLPRGDTALQASALWKTYDNPEMGLSFSFPAHWGVVSRPVEGNRKSVLVIADSVRIYLTRYRDTIEPARRLSDDSVLGSRTVVIAGDTCVETSLTNTLFQTRRLEIRLPALAIQVNFLHYLPDRTAPDSAAVDRLLSTLKVGICKVDFATRPTCEGIADFRYSWFPKVPHSNQIPEFAQFPAATERRSKPAQLDLNSNPLAREYRTRFREGLRAGPNFAGHYTLVEWGCGTQCEEFGIVDTRTGKVLNLRGDLYFNLLDDGYFTFRLHYCVNSRLLVTVGNYPDDFHSGRGEARFYELVGDTLKCVYMMDTRNSHFEGQ